MGATTVNYMPRDVCNYYKPYASGCMGGYYFVKKIYKFVFTFFFNYFEILSIYYVNFSINSYFFFKYYYG